jgi:hypothetical protein
MLEVVTEKRQSGEPKEDRIRKLEGWILGQTSGTSLPGETSRTVTAEAQDWSALRSQAGQIANENGNQGDCSTIICAKTGDISGRQSRISLPATRGGAA